jgi:hypothetical protein
MGRSRSEWNYTLLETSSRASEVSLKAVAAASEKRKTVQIEKRFNLGKKKKDSLKSDVKFVAVKEIVMVWDIAGRFALNPSDYKAYGCVLSELSFDTLSCIRCRMFHTSTKQ